MISFRKSHPSIGRPIFWREDVTWYGSDGQVETEPESRCLAYLLKGASFYDNDLYVMINSHWKAHNFTIPSGMTLKWHRLVDTSQPSPDDIMEPGNEPLLEKAGYNVRARSVVVLINKFALTDE